MHAFAIVSLGSVAQRVFAQSSFVRGWLPSCWSCTFVSGWRPQSPQIWPALFSWCRSQKARVDLEPALDEPVDELLRLVGPAGGGDAEAERRVGGDDVDLVLLAELDERGAGVGIGEGELAPRPLEDEQVGREVGALPAGDLGRELLLEEVGRAFVLDDADAHRPRHRDAEPVAPAARWTMPSIDQVTCRSRRRRRP